MAATNRTDDVEGLAVRTSAEVIRLTVLTAVTSLMAVLVAQVALSLAHRREDEILHVLGSRRRTLALVAAGRGTLIGLAGTGIGAGIGMVGTLWGLAVYRSFGRFAAPDALAPIPVMVPPVVVVALVALPVLSGLVGAAVGVARPPLDALAKTRRLAW